jgi:ABC-type branched-subunit amino acid transport system substrate-binding protein
LPWEARPDGTFVARQAGDSGKVVVSILKEVVMNSMLKLGRTLVVVAMVGQWVGIAQAEDGITANEILICSYQPMTGNESSYYRMGKGADAWFRYVNESGGINGRKVNFVMVDDQYQPAVTTSVVKRFIERDKCFAIVSALGSAPTAAVVEYVTSQNVPLIGPGTGAAKVLDFPASWVFRFNTDATRSKASSWFGLQGGIRAKNNCSLYRMTVRQDAHLRH